VGSHDEQRFMPGLRAGFDPQSELVRRYARILRSAPAEAWKPRSPSAKRAMTPPRFAHKGAPSVPADLRDAAPEA
jgi:hypothetical protein